MTLAEAARRVIDRVIQEAGYDDEDLTGCARLAVHHGVPLYACSTCGDPAVYMLDDENACRSCAAKAEWPRDELPELETAAEVLARKKAKK